MKNLFNLTVTVLATFLFFSCSSDDLNLENQGTEDFKTESSITNASIIEVLRQNERLTTLVEILEETEFSEALSGNDNFTIFAPTNEAFSSLEGDLDLESLIETLSYHAILGNFDSNSLLELDSLETLQGTDIEININEVNEIIINNSVKIITTDIQATNGVVHIIDQVLVPNFSDDEQSLVDAIASVQDLSKFSALLSSEGFNEFVEAEESLTIFAPSNEAFETLEEIPSGNELSNILQYHIVRGKLATEDLVSKQTILTTQGDVLFVEQQEGSLVIKGEIEILTTEIETSSVIVYKIDSVLIPNGVQTISGIISTTSELSTLSEILSATDFNRILNEESSFTIFAPTNKAFESLNELPSNVDLAEILLYHVVAGSFEIEQLVSAGVFSTIQGQEIKIERVGDDVILNDKIKIVVEDVVASNGRINIIDNILLLP
ncbi:hypothetical protein GCM10009430_32370 [Aquimarina litoralis]|uniref:FAS1 domain-containing protein n=1 Tax=Aquimarina litoralis TaxID=584605 RepID=A0ABN1J1K3_9FLAO